VRVDLRGADVGVGVAVADADADADDDDDDVVVVDDPEEDVDEERVRLRTRSPGSSTGNSSVSDVRRLRGLFLGVGAGVVGEPWSASSCAATARAL